MAPTLTTAEPAAAPEPPAPATRPVLEVEGLTVDYGALRALDSVHLEVRPGEVLALAGENGAGKSTLVRCIAGTVAPTAGTLRLGGRRLRASPGAAARAGVSVVWQDLALCDNLDVAANLHLGRERRLGLLSATRAHREAEALLDRLGIPLPDVGRPVADLSGGQRQMVAVARAMRDQPRLLVLDEPTASLGVHESAQVEQLALRVRERGTTVLLVTHDVEQMFRLADRIVVLRHGRVAGELDPAAAHPDDVVAVLNGQPPDSSARRQLRRLHGLADQLAAADPSSALPLVLSALAGALGAEQLCVHLLEGGRLRVAASLGLAPDVAAGLDDLAVGEGGGTIGRAAGRQEVVVAGSRPVRLSVPVPGAGPGGLGGVLTVFRPAPGRPADDEVELVSLYAGYVASAVERERLLGQLTDRNRLLETIREVLEVLAGPVPLADGLPAALAALRDGLGAEEVALYRGEATGPACRAAAGAGTPPAAGVVAAATRLLAGPGAPGGPDVLGVGFATPAGRCALVARWAVAPGRDAGPLLEDAAHSLRLALEREESERAHREATAARRSRGLQQQFLSRLSHELRTPLTAIHGYASSLMQPDVRWDEDSERRFLSRIATESGRLARLVDDLLDSSAIESGTLRIQADWCDLGLVLDSARACLPLERAAAVEVRATTGLPAVWADHDRLEQVFVNLLDNAVRHNPPGTSVLVEARCVDGGEVAEVVVGDDGPGMDAAGRRPSAGAGLGLSIARGIVEAHGGQLAVRSAPGGTRATVRLPVERRDGGDDGG